MIFSQYHCDLYYATIQLIEKTVTVRFPQPTAFPLLYPLADRPFPSSPLLFPTAPQGAAHRRTLRPLLSSSLCLCHVVAADCGARGGGRLSPQRLHAVDRAHCRQSRRRRRKGRAHGLSCAQGHSRAYCAVERESEGVGKEGKGEERRESAEEKNKGV